MSQAPVKQAAPADETRPTMHPPVGTAIGRGVRVPVPVIRAHQVERLDRYEESIQFRPVLHGKGAELDTVGGHREEDEQLVGPSGREERGSLPDSVDLSLQTDGGRSPPS